MVTSDASLQWTAWGRPRRPTLPTYSGGMARDLRRHGSRPMSPHRDEAVRITTAASNRNDEIAARQKRYLISMTLRSLCFVGAIIAALAHVGWLWPILIAGALILPYIAVVMANAVMTKNDGVDLLDGRYVRELGTGADRSRHDTPNEDVPHP